MHFENSFIICDIVDAKHVIFKAGFLDQNFVIKLLVYGFTSPWQV